LSVHRYSEQSLSRRPTLRRRDPRQRLYQQMPSAICGTLHDLMSVGNLAQPRAGGLRVRQARAVARNATLQSTAKGRADRGDAHATGGTPMKGLRSPPDCDKMPVFRERATS
jgi:hypothetical protein